MSIIKNIINSVDNVSKGESVDMISALMEYQQEGTKAFSKFPSHLWENLYFVKKIFSLERGLTPLGYVSEKLFKENQDEIEDLLENFDAAHLNKVLSEEIKINYIYSNKRMMKKWIGEDHTFFHKASEEIKKDKNLLFMFLTNSVSELEKRDIDLIPDELYQDEVFMVKLINEYPDILKNLSFVEKVNHNILLDNFSDFLSAAKRNIILINKDVISEHLIIDYMKDNRWPSLSEIYGDMSSRDFSEYFLKHYAYYNYKELAEKHKENVNITKYAVTNERSYIWYEIPEKLRENKEIIITCLHSNIIWDNLRDIDKADFDIGLVNTHYAGLEKKDKDLYHPDLWKSEEFLMAIVKKQARDYKYIPAEYQKNIKVIKALLLNRIEYYDELSSEVKKDIAINTKLIKSGFIKELSVLDPKIKYNTNIITMLVKENPHELNKILEKKKENILNIFSDKKIIMAIEKDVKKAYNSKIIDLDAYTRFNEAFMRYRGEMLNEKMENTKPFDSSNQIRKKV